MVNMLVLDKFAAWVADMPVAWAVDMPVAWAVDMPVARAADRLAAWAADMSAARAADRLAAWAVDMPVAPVADTWVARAAWVADRRTAPVLVGASSSRCPVQTRPQGFYHSWGRANFLSTKCCPSKGSSCSVIPFPFSLRQLLGPRVASTL